MFLVARMPPSKYRASQVSDLLLTATDNPDPGVAARLLDEGAVLDQLDAYSRTAAMDAAAKGNLAVLRLFAQRGLEVGRRDSRGNTLLHQFVLEDVAGRPDPEAMVRWLVAQGVDPNAANEEGLRPLSGWLTDDPSRAGTRRRETLRALLAHGADPRLPGAGSRDASALDWARQNRMEGFPDLLQELERSTTKAE